MITLVCADILSSFFEKSTASLSIFIFVSGIICGIEFVVSQFVVKGEMHVLASLSKEVDRMRTGLAYYVHHLNDSLSKKSHAA
jgi:hypothetical protein